MEKSKEINLPISRVSCRNLENMIQENSIIMYKAKKKEFEIGKQLNQIIESNKIKQLEDLDRLPKEIRNDFIEKRKEAFILESISLDSFNEETKLVEYYNEGCLIENKKLTQGEILKRKKCISIEDNILADTIKRKNLSEKIFDINDEVNKIAMAVAFGKTIEILDKEKFPIIDDILNNRIKPYKIMERTQQLQQKREELTKETKKINNMLIKNLEEFESDCPSISKINDELLDQIVEAKKQEETNIMSDIKRREESERFYI